MVEENGKTFEDSLNELEKIATNLENGELGLEEAIKEFEKGMKLSKECTEKLDDAEKKNKYISARRRWHFKRREFCS